ncbi:MAG: CpaF family protein [Actinomycetota bacterium]
MSKLVSILSDRARSRLQQGDLTVPKVIDQVLDEQFESEPISPSSEAALRGELEASLSAFGALEPLLQDTSIEEIWINSPKQIFVASSGVPKITNLEIAPDELRTLIEKMLRHTGRRLDRSNPFVDASLPDGSRLHVVIPEITRANWSVNIRKFPERNRNLADLESLGSITQAQRDFLSAAIKSGKNVLVSGATQAGKTTLLCALLQEVAQQERIVSVEETFEINLDAVDWVAMQTRQPNLEGVGEISLRRLVKEALRMRPGRIVIGEVREAESFDLLIALNSGLPGLCTIHANSAFDAITKLCTLPLLAGGNITSDFVNPTVGNCIDLVVHSKMLPGGARRVEEIQQVHWDQLLERVELKEVQL